MFGRWDGEWSMRSLVGLARCGHTPRTVEHVERRHLADAPVLGRPDGRVHLLLADDELAAFDLLDGTQRIREPQARFGGVFDVDGLVAELGTAGFLQGVTAEPEPRVLVSRQSAPPPSSPP